MTPSSVHIDSALNSFALGYVPQGMKFMADEIFPVIPTAKKSDKYFIKGQEHLDNQTAIGKRNPVNGHYGRVQHDYSSASFSCEDYGLEEPIFDPIPNNADTGLDPKRDAVIVVREQMAIMKELRVMNAVVAATGLSYDSPLASGARWNDQTGSDPYGDIQTLVDAVEDNTGQTPNRLQMNKAAFRALQKHPDILERIKYGGGPANPASVTRQMLEQLFELDKIVVTNAVYNSAKQGQNRTVAKIWPKSVVAFYFPTSIYFGVSTFGAQMSWRGDTNGQDMIVEEYRDESARADIVRIRHNRDEIVAGATFAARLTTVVD